MNQAALDNMRERRSCRSYRPDMPTREQIAAVCEAGTYAPTGHGRQSPRIIAITRRDLRDRLSAMNARIWNELTLARTGKSRPISDPFYGAPVVLVVLADKGVPTYLYDGCSVLCNMANAANAVGLASCWIHRAKEEFSSPEGRAILQELGIESDYEGIGHLILGYPAAEAPTPLPRKDDYVIWAE